MESYNLLLPYFYRYSKFLKFGILNIYEGISIYNFIMN